MADSVEGATSSIGPDTPELARPSSLVTVPSTAKVNRDFLLGTSLVERRGHVMA